MGIFTKGQRSIHRRTQEGIQANPIGGEVVRVIYDPSKVPPGKSGKTSRGPLHLSVLRSGKTAKRKAGTRAQHSIMTGVLFLPNAVNNLTPEQFEAVQRHQDFKGLVELGALRITNARLSDDGETPMTTGTTLDYEPGEAIAIAQNSISSEFLQNSLAAESQAMNAEPGHSPREAVYSAVRNRLEYLDKETNRKLTNAMSPAKSPMTNALIS